MAGTVTSADVQAANKAGLEQARQNLNAMIAAAKLGTVDGLAKFGVRFVAALKLELSEPGHGRLYYIRRSRKTGHRYLGGPPDTSEGYTASGTHSASAPGEPPAPDLGTYRASWVWVEGEIAGAPYIEVGTSDKRGPWLEFGTRHMAARPHLRPTVEKMTADLREQLVASITEKQEEALAALFTKVASLGKDLL